MENEKRLIDANAFEVVTLKDVSDEFAEGARFILEKLDAAPTVDAVEVIRCKDCKHWNELKGKDSGKLVGYGDCRNDCGINGIAYEDSFCSYGEKREV